MRIELLGGTKSHLLQMRGLKPPADVAGPIMGTSHLLQMRGLKHKLWVRRFIFRSHLLQMRGLNPPELRVDADRNSSHLLQMRGLKRLLEGGIGVDISRIFYRCVD